MEIKTNYTTNLTTSRLKAKKSVQSRKNNTQKIAQTEVNANISNIDSHVNMSKIEILRTEIRNGSYNTDIEGIASAILKLDD